MNSLTVGDMMSRELVTVQKQESLASARDKMYSHRIRHLPVVDREGAVLGLVSQRDLLRNTLMERPHLSSYVEDSILEELMVEQVMITELELAQPSTDLRDAARTMLYGKLGCLPVVEEGHLVGILTEADFLRAVLYED